jgi:hypothetical protein
MTTNPSRASLSSSPVFIIQGPVKILSIRKTDFEIHINLIHGIKIWGYQIGDQKPYVKEGQTTQWPKEKGQKEKQWSIKCHWKEEVFYYISYIYGYWVYTDAKSKFSFYFKLCSLNYY